MEEMKKPDIGNNWVLNPNQTLEAIEAEFDESAAVYEESSHDWDYRGAREGAAFFARHVAKDAHVMDVGCGTGLVGQELFGMGYHHLTGCDISASMLALAHEKGVYSRGLHKADIRTMPLADNGYDALVCIAVLTYAPDIEEVFAEFDRLIRPGGCISFSHRVDLEPRFGFSRALARRLENGDWKMLQVTQPQLYYPKKTDYADKIMIRYHAYQRGAI